MSPPRPRPTAVRRGSRRSLIEVQLLDGGEPKPDSPLAAIDIGSNSIHMVVAEPAAGGGFKVVDRERDMVRLGRSALGDGRLSKRAIEDGLVALVKMTTLARLKGAQRVVAVATSAVREADNGQDFLDQVRARTGLAVQRLSGTEEARLIYRAVREAVDLGEGWAVIADVGGGSTEWIATEGGELREVASLTVGSLRCAGRLKGDPPTRRSRKRLRSELRRRVAELPLPGRAEQLIATSGTAACCADLADHFAGRSLQTAGGLKELTLKDLERVIDALSGMQRAEIAALPPVGGPRSESILAGAVLLAELAGRAGVDRLQVSDRALREGLVLEVIGRPVAALPAPGEVRRQQVLKLAARCPQMLDHAHASARLAVRLFDLTPSLHGLGAREREWLEYAALLHDIGYLVDYRAHHKHSYYLIANAPLSAFDPREIEVIAHVARYHRRALPNKSEHPSYRALKGWQRKTVNKLAALLRVADSLDRSHAQRVEDFFCAIKKRKVVIEVLSDYDVELELSSARKRDRLFKKAFGRKVAFRQARRPE